MSAVLEKNFECKSPSPPPCCSINNSSPSDMATTPEEEDKTTHHHHNHDNASSAASESEHESERVGRRYGAAGSVCSETGDEEDTDEEEDAKLKAERELELGPQCSLKDQLEKDKDDESLRRWKEQLLGSVDYSAVGETLEPEVQILSLTILSPGRPELVLPIPFDVNAKGYAFTLKDGSRYRLKFSFVVSNNIVSGFKYTNTVWKTGVRVENTKVMLGTFSPQLEPYTYELDEETTPSGMFARGSYSARTKFVDDDGKCYLDISYSFEIRKDWA